MKPTDFILTATLQHHWSGDWEAAAAWANQGLRHKPDDGRMHVAAGIAAFHRELFGEAIFHLETASALVPLEPEPQLLLAELYMQFGLIRAATAILTYLAEEERCPVPLMPRLSKNLGRAGQFGSALAVCERLSELRPSYHPAWFGIAYYRGQLGQPAKMLEAPLRRAYELTPRAVPYRINLAAVLASLEQVHESYQLIAGLSPEVVGCPAICRLFTLVCQAANDHELARRFQQRGQTLQCHSNDTEEFMDASQQLDSEEPK